MITKEKNSSDVDNCKRVRCTFKGERYYFLVGKNWIMPKIPYEYRVENSEVRETLDKLCADITAALEELR